VKTECNGRNTDLSNFSLVRAVWTRLKFHDKSDEVD